MIFSPVQAPEIAELRWPISAPGQRDVGRGGDF